MKKIVVLVLIAAFAVLSVSCGASGGPEDVAMQFATHMTSGDFEKAAELSTPETRELINFLAMMSGDENPSENNAKITHVSTDIDGETATVVITAGGEEQTLSLKKIEGNWLVDLNKDSLNMDKDAMDL